MTPREPDWLDARRQGTRCEDPAASRSAPARPPSRRPAGLRRDRRRRSPRSAWPRTDGPCCNPGTPSGNSRSSCRVAQPISSHDDDRRFTWRSFARHSRRSGAARRILPSEHSGTLKADVRCDTAARRSERRAGQSVGSERQQRGLERSVTIGLAGSTHRESVTSSAGTRTVALAGTGPAVRAGRPDGPHGRRSARDRDHEPAILREADRDGRRLTVDGGRVAFTSAADPIDAALFACKRSIGYGRSACPNRCSARRASSRPGWLSAVGAEGRRVLGCRRRDGTRW